MKPAVYWLGFCSDGGFTKHRFYRGLNVTLLHITNENCCSLLHTDLDCVLTLWTCSFVSPVGADKDWSEITWLFFMVSFFFSSRIISSVLQFLQVIPCSWQPIIFLWQVITFTEEPGNEIGRRTERRRCAIKKSNNAFTASCRHRVQHSYRDKCQNRPSYSLCFLVQTIFAELLHVWLDRVLIVICTIKYLHIYGN